MEFSLTGTVLTKDLFAADGRIIASRGEVVDLPFIKDVAAKAPQGLRERPLFETTTADAVLEAFETPALLHLVGTEGLRAIAADALSEVRFPQQVWDELDALRREDAPRHQHAIWTGVVAARLFRAALGTAPALQARSPDARGGGGARRSPADRRAHARQHSGRRARGPLRALASHSRRVRISARAGAGSPARDGHRLGGERFFGADRAQVVPAAAVQCPRGGGSVDGRGRGRTLRSPGCAAPDPLPARSEGPPGRAAAPSQAHRLPSTGEPPRRGA